MADRSPPSENPAPYLHRRAGRGRVALAASLAALAGTAALVGRPAGEDAPLATSAGGGSGSMPARKAVAVAAPGAFDGMMSPSLSMAPEALRFGAVAPLGAAFRPLPARPAAGVDPADPERGRPPLAPLPPARDAVQLVHAAPLPMPRPAELRALTAPELPRTAERQGPRRIETASIAPAPEDNRSLIDRLFGAKPPAGPALAYAAPEGIGTDSGLRARLSPLPDPSAGSGTAVYDISARVVTLPNGDKIEAHSGLGDKLDDPRHVHLRMRGATPPGTYDLTERERPFHGVRALRLNPVGGSGAVHGRAGLLAHTYMLGPNGDSNGCVSFKDYDKFLTAYLRGEVRRLVVVPGRGSDGWPGFARQGTSPIGRLARAGNET